MAAATTRICTVASHDADGLDMLVDMQETERFVHDLVWAVNSPFLMNLTGYLPAAAQSLQIGDVDREHLKDYLTNHREKRVGRYFERLIAYWIRYLRGCEIVAQTQQLCDGKRTVGEIDLLFLDEHGRLNHWEVACKFYLQVGLGDPSATDYVGPNAKDTLQKKAIRLLEHQLPLGSQYYSETEIQHAFVKGRIFYHWQTGLKNPLPVELAADHLSGKWLRASEAAQVIGASQLSYRILRKPFWLADEIINPSSDDVLSAREATRFLKDHFGSRQTPILISSFPDRTSSARESERLFIVSNQWPQPDAALQ